MDSLRTRHDSNKKKLFPYLILQNVLTKCCRSYIKVLPLCAMLIGTLLVFYITVTNHRIVRLSVQDTTAFVQVKNITPNLLVECYTPSTQNIYRLETKPHRTEKPKDNTIKRTLNNIEKCMQASNLDKPHLLPKAKQNAKLFVTQYRKVIPINSLPDHTGHCWKTRYCISARHKDKVRGYIGNTTFHTQVSELWFGQRMVQDLFNNFQGRFCSSKVCLPNIYLLGFEKSGSTFLWCVLSKVMNYNLSYTLSNTRVNKLRHFWNPFDDYYNRKRTKLQTDKETYFWTPFDYRPSPPDPENLAGAYVPMFLRAFDPKYHSENVTIIDGCPSTAIEWPRFHNKDPDLVNYCLLPSALPELFPQSKYIMIMRNPVDMLYSAFWWSFYQANTPNLKSDTVAKKIRTDPLMGPLYFHVRMNDKIVQFLTCINDHSSVKYKPMCELWGSNDINFSSCIAERTHLLANCVANITNRRELGEAVLHRGMYYVHVLKWLQTVPRDRIVFTTLERLSNDVHSTIKEIYGIIQKDTVLPLDKETVEEITRSCKENKNEINYKNGLQLRMRLDTEYILEKFFQPFNKMLSDLLGDEQFLWKKH